MQRLRIVLVLLFVGAVVVPATVISVSTYRQIHDEMTINLKENFTAQIVQIEHALNITFSQIASSVEFMADYAVVGDALGHMTDYRSSEARLMTPLAGGAQERRLFEFFEQFTAAKPHIAYLYLGDRSGGYVQWPQGDTTANYDPRQRPWYLTGEAAAGEVVRASVYYWAPDDATVISTVKAITDSQGVAGVLGMDVEAKQLAAMVDSVEYGFDGRIILVQGDGVVISDTLDSSKHLQSVVDAYGEQVSSLMSTMQAGKFYPVSLQGVEQMILSYKLSDFGGVFYLMVPQQQIESALNERARMMIALSALCILLFSAMAYFVSSRIADVIANSQKLLQVEKDAAQRATLAKDRFLANMSHEIRTPLNGIFGYLQLLQFDAQGEAKQYVDNAMASGQALMVIVNDILDFAKIEADELRLDEQPFSLPELLDPLVAEYRCLAQEKDLRLTVQLHPKLNPGWRGDPLRIAQILRNLLSNAIKFTQQGSVTLSVSCDQRGLYFSVEDSGIGMSAGALNKVFNRFEQADSSTTRKYGGTGLGMAISKQLAELMGGKLRVSSKEGIGSTFELFLPLEAVDDEVIPIAVESVVDPLAPPQLDGVKILLAEDNRVNQSLFTGVMKRTGAQIKLASDGMQAVQIASQWHPDMIFMDIQMPKMDGDEAFKIIHAQQPQIPVVAMTASVVNDQLRRTLSDGFCCHLCKPFNIGELYTVAASCVKRR